MRSGEYHDRPLPYRQARHGLGESLKEAAAVITFLAGVAAAFIVLGAVLGGCAAVAPLASAAGGWYTHDRIDYLEQDRVNGLEARVQRLEREQ